jgi:hypothetical protein
MPFSIVDQGEGWFWCSLLEVRGNELIGPFPSQEEARKMRGRHWGLKRISPRPLSQRNYSQWRVAGVSAIRLRTVLT